MRDDRIAPRGELRDEWFELFVSHPDRFMVGIDTYSLSRWQEYPKIAGKIREWTSQLPEEVALRLTYENAAEAFHPEMRGSDSANLTPASLPRHD